MLIICTQISDLLFRPVPLIIFCTPMGFERICSICFRDLLHISPLLLFSVISNTLHITILLCIHFIIRFTQICHQLKSFDRPGHQMVDCDSYALLQMRIPKSNSHSLAVNAYYHIRMPIEGFYYLTIYASSNADSDTDHLECVYRILIDVRKTRTCPSAISAFPRQTFWWVQCRLLEPLCQRLCINRQYTFRLDAPQYDSVAVVINEADWHFLSPTSPAGRWTGKVLTGEFLGQLSVFARFARGPDGFRNPLTGCKGASDDAIDEEEDAYVKLLDYLLVE